MLRNTSTNDSVKNIGCPDCGLRALYFRHGVLMTKPYSLYIGTSEGSTIDFEVLEDIKGFVGGYALISPNALEKELIHYSNRIFDSVEEYLKVKNIINETLSEYKYIYLIDNLEASSFDIAGSCLPINDSISNNSFVYISFHAK